MRGRARRATWRHLPVWLAVAAGALIAPAFHMPGTELAPRAVWVNLDVLMRAHPGMGAVVELENYRAFLQSPVPSSDPLPDPPPFTLLPFPTPAPTPLLDEQAQQQLVDNYLAALGQTLRSGIVWRQRELRAQLTRDAAQRGDAFEAARRARLRTEWQEVLHRHRERLADLRIAVTTLRGRQGALAARGETDPRLAAQLRDAEAALDPAERALREALDAADAWANQEITAFRDALETEITEHLRARQEAEEDTLRALLAIERRTLLDELTAPEAQLPPDRGGAVTLEPGHIADVVTQARAAHARRAAHEEATRTATEQAVRRVQDRLRDGLRAEVRAQVQAWTTAQGYEVHWEPRRGLRDVTHEALAALAPQWREAPGAPDAD